MPFLQRATLWKLSLAVAALLIGVTTAAADMFKVYLNRATVRSRPNGLSRVVPPELKRGDEVEARLVVGPDGKSKWYELTQTPYGVLNPPAYLPEVALNPDRPLVPGSKVLSKGADDPAVTGSVKLLTEEEAKAAKSGGFDFAAVDRMQQSAAGVHRDFFNPASATQRFRSDGRLGEFGAWGAAEAAK